jgi:hypothetical protein
VGSQTFGWNLELKLGPGLLIPWFPLRVQTVYLVGCSTVVGFMHVIQRSISSAIFSSTFIPGGTPYTFGPLITFFHDAQNSNFLKLYIYLHYHHYDPRYLLRPHQSLSSSSTCIYIPTRICSYNTLLPPSLLFVFMFFFFIRFQLWFTTSRCSWGFFVDSVMDRDYRGYPYVIYGYGICGLIING